MSRSLVLAHYLSKIFILKIYELMDKTATYLVAVNFKTLFAKNMPTHDHNSKNGKLLLFD